MNGLRTLVRALHSSTRQVEREVGISAAQLFVLEGLAHSSASSINQIAEWTGTHQSSVSTVVARLVERGLARRAAAPEDGRRQQVEITPEGRALLSGAPPSIPLRLRGALKRIAPEQVALLADALEVWLSEAELADAAPPMFFEEAEVAGTGTDGGKALDG